MPSFSTERRVSHSAAQMLALVADVAQYPKFLPLCTGLKILSREQVADGENLVARMSVGYRAISESFTTRVTVRPAANRIDVSYVDGPFRRLVNVWRFEDSPPGSIIHFNIDYEFKSPLLGALVGSMFDQAFRKFAEAFESRANDVYGRGAGA